MTETYPISNYSFFWVHQNLEGHTTKVNKWPQNIKLHVEIVK